MDVNDFKIEQYKTTSMLCVKREGPGAIPRELSGVFTKEQHAKNAIACYVASAPEKVDYTPEITPLIALDMLTKKDMLLEFAEEMDIVVPSSMKQPASIKKYLKEQLENA